MFPGGQAIILQLGTLFDLLIKSGGHMTLFVGMEVDEHLFAEYLMGLRELLDTHSAEGIDTHTLQIKSYSQMAA